MALNADAAGEALEEVATPDPEGRELLSRLAAMLDAIVGDNWWFDRDALQDRLPVN